MMVTRLIEGQIVTYDSPILHQMEYRDRKVEETMAEHYQDDRYQRRREWNARMDDYSHLH